MGQCIINRFMFTIFYKKFIFNKNVGAIIGATIFYLVTNFGIWTTGLYGFTYKGLITSYALAIPFFTYSIISTLVFSVNRNRL